LEEREARQILRHFKVTGLQVDTILRLLDDVPTQDPVEKIYINLAADTDAEYYLKFGRRILPTYNTFQLALDLYQDHRLSEAMVVKVAFDLVQNYNFGVEDLERSLDELVRRPILGDKTVESIVPVLQQNRLIRADFAPTIPPKAIMSSVGQRIFELEGVTEPWVPEHIDYMRDDR
jgi:hypothetical protein